MAPSYQSPEQTCSGRLFSCSEVELIEFVSSLAMVEMSSRTHCSVRNTPDGLIIDIVNNCGKSRIHNYTDTKSLGISIY